MARQGLGQRENALNSAKDLEAAHGGGFGFFPEVCFALQHNLLRVDRKTDGVGGQNLSVQQSLGLSVVLVQMNGN